MRAELESIVRDLAEQIGSVVQTAPSISILSARRDEETLPLIVRASTTLDAVDTPVQLFYPPRGSPPQPCYQAADTPLGYRIIQHAREVRVTPAGWYHPVFQGRRAHLFPIDTSEHAQHGVLALTYPLRHPYKKHQNSRSHVVSIVNTALPKINHILSHGSYRIALIAAPEEELADAIPKVCNPYGYETLTVRSVKEAIEMLRHAPAVHEHGFDVLLLTDAAVQTMDDAMLDQLYQAHSWLPVVHIGADDQKGPMRNFSSHPLESLTTYVDPKKSVRYPLIIQHLDEQVHGLDMVRCQAFTVFAEAISPENIRGNGRSAAQPPTFSEKLRQDIVYSEVGHLNLMRLLATGLYSTTLSRDGVTKIRTPAHGRGRNLYVRKGPRQEVSELRDLLLTQSRIRRRVQDLHTRGIDGEPTWNVVNVNLHFNEGDLGYLVTKEAGPDAFRYLFTQSQAGTDIGIQKLHELCKAVMQFNAALPAAYPTIQGQADDISAYVNQTWKGALREIALPLAFYPFNGPETDEIHKIFFYLNGELPLIEQAVRERYQNLAKHPGIDAFPGNMAFDDDGGITLFDLGNLRATPISFEMVSLLTIGNMFGAGRLLSREDELTLLDSAVEQYNTAIQQYNHIVNEALTDMHKFLMAEIDHDVRERPWMRELGPLLKDGFQPLAGRELYAALPDVLDRTMRLANEYLMQREPFANDPGMRDAGRDYIRSYIHELAGYAGTLQTKQVENSSPEAQRDAYTAFQFFKALRFIGHLLGTSHLQAMTNPLESPMQVDPKQRSALLRPIEKRLWDISHTTMDVALQSLNDLYDVDLTRRAEVANALSTLDSYLMQASLMEARSECDPHIYARHIR